jgi:hypothetical protein
MGSLVEDVDGAFDSVKLVEKLRYRLVQFGCVSSSWRRGDTCKRARGQRARPSKAQSQRRLTQ